MKVAKIAGAAALGLLLLGVGCKKNQPAPAAAPVHYTPVDYTTGGTIQGTIHYAGTPPKPILIDMSQDPGCSLGAANYSEGFVVNKGGLANVFIYVKSGLDGKVYASPTTPVVIDQKNCHYVPHVVGAMMNQPVEFVNQDPTMHNIHITPTVPGNQAVDISQAPSRGQDDRSFAKPELMMAVRCNNHPWMQGFINIVDNPFYAVSDATGHFTIRGLPPGTYTLVADQENLGRQTATVRVAAKQTVKQDFTYSGSTHLGQ